MASAFTLDILTPQGVVVQNLDCKGLYVPTAQGEINVLENHTHILTQLSTGVLTVVDSENSSRYFSITSGVCKILGDKVSVLSTTTEAAENIDLERAKTAKKNAESKLQNTLTEDEHTKYYRKLQRAEARLKMTSKS